MYPPYEHTFYAWLIIIAAVCIVAFTGAVLSRIRFMHANRAVIQDRRRRTCIKQ